MNHHEIEQQDLTEKYVRHQLPPATRRVFQEHYFACEECFEQVQTVARFIAGVQRSSRVGVLAESTRASPAASAWWAHWFKPAFALAATACLLLAAALGWLVFNQLPKLQAELAQERQAREALVRQQEQDLQAAQAGLEKERQQAAHEKAEREKLQTQIARHQSPTPVPRQNTETTANVPVVILEATREVTSGPPFKLPAHADALTLWVEVEAGHRFDSYQMQLFAASGRAVKTINGLHANSYGALAVSVSTRQLPPGKYLVKLFGLQQQQKELVGEYDLLLHQ